MTVADDLLIERPGQVGLRVPRGVYGLTPAARSATVGHRVLTIDRGPDGRRVVREFRHDDGRLAEHAPLESWEQSVIAILAFGVPVGAAVGVEQL